jgi:hypothetical protein
MKFHLFNFKRSGAILVFLGCGCCLTGILPAAELRPLLEDDSKTPILPQNGSAVVETNRSLLPSPTKPDAKVKMTVKPDEFDFRQLLNLPMSPPPSRVPTTSGKKDGDLLDQENAWGSVTPQDILDDYMARHILNMSESAPDGRKRKGSALERFYARLARGDGTTNGMSTLALFGLEKRSPNQTDKDEKSDDRDNVSGRSRPDDLFGDVPDTILGTSLLGRQSGSDLSGANKNIKDISLEADRVKRAQKDHLDEVRKVWSFESPLTAGSADPTGISAWQKSMSEPFPDTLPGSTRPSQLSPLPGALPGTSFNPSARPGLPTASAIPGAAPTPVTAPASPPSIGPLIPPPQRTTRPVSTPFAVPQRKF